MKSSIEKKRSIAVVVIIGLTALLLAGPWGIVAGDDDGRARCKPGGAYIGKDSGGATWSQTIAPCDPACNRMTGVVKFANISPVGPAGTSYPLFPTTEFRTDFVANLIRTGRNTWDFTWIGYGVQKPTEYGYALPLTFIMGAGLVLRSHSCQSPYIFVGIPELIPQAGLGITSKVENSLPSLS